MGEYTPSLEEISEFADTLGVMYRSGHRDDVFWFGLKAVDYMSVEFITSPGTRRLAWAMLQGLSEEIADVQSVITED